MHYFSSPWICSRASNPAFLNRPPLFFWPLFGAQPLEGRVDRFLNRILGLPLPDQQARFYLTYRLFIYNLFAAEHSLGRLRFRD